MTKKDIASKHEPTAYSIDINAVIRQINLFRGLAGVKKKYSQYQLAKDSGVPQPTVSRILSGETKQPSVEIYFRLLKVVEDLHNKELPEDAKPIELLHQIQPMASVVNTSRESVMPLATEAIKSGDQALYMTLVNNEIDQYRLVKALEILKEDVGDWYTDKDNINIARLIMMAYDRVPKEEK